MKIISWNVNGIRARFEEVRNLAKKYRPDFLCLQKVRCNSGREDFQLEGYKSLYSDEDFGSWSGVMTYVCIPDEVLVSENPITFRINTPMLSKQGHLQIYHCQQFYLVNAYVPFYNPSLEGAEEYRMDWDNRFLKDIKTMAKELPIVICGDMNIVHSKLDTYETRLEQRRPNFSKWERDNFDRLLKECYLVDVYRQFHSREQAVTFYGNFRETGLGSRIDYFLVSLSILPDVTAAEILSDYGSGQSVPILLEFLQPCCCFE